MRPNAQRQQQQQKRQRRQQQPQQVVAVVLVLVLPPVVLVVSCPCVRAQEQSGSSSAVQQGHWSRLACGRSVCV